MGKQPNSHSVSLSEALSRLLEASVNRQLDAEIVRLLDGVDDEAARARAVDDSSADAAASSSSSSSSSLRNDAGFARCVAIGLCREPLMQDSVDEQNTSAPAAAASSQSAAASSASDTVAECPSSSSAAPSNVLVLARHAPASASSSSSSSSSAPCLPLAIVRATVPTSHRRSRQEFELGRPIVIHVHGGTTNIYQSACSSHSARHGRSGGLGVDERDDTDDDKAGR